MLHFYYGIKHDGQWWNFAEEKWSNDLTIECLVEFVTRAMMTLKEHGITGQIDKYKITRFDDRN